MKRCPKCSTEYPDCDSFCMICGKKLEIVKPVVPEEVSNLTTKVGDMESRMSEFEGGMPDVKPLESRVKELEKVEVPDFSPIESRVKELEKVEVPDFSPIESRVKELERVEVPDVKPLESRVRELEKTLESRTRELEKRAGKIDNITIPDMGPVESRIRDLERVVQKLRPIESMAKNIEIRLGRIESAAMPNLGPIESVMRSMESRMENLEKVTPPRGRADTPSKLGGLESRVRELEKAKIPDVRSLESRVKELERTGTPDFGPMESKLEKIGLRVIDIERGLGKRVKDMHDKVKKFPGSELVSLLSKVGDIESTVDELGVRVDSFSYPELPDDITEISKNIRRIERLGESSKDLRDSLKELRKGLDFCASQSEKSWQQTSKRIDAIPKISIKEITGLKEKVAEASSRFNESAKVSSDVISNVEKRMDSRISALENGIKGLTEVQRKIELMEINPSKIKTDVKREVMQDVLRELRGLVS